MSIKDCDDAELGLVEIALCGAFDTTGDVDQEAMEALRGRCRGRAYFGGPRARIGRCGAK